MSRKIGDHQIGHGATGLHRSAGLVRLEHNIVHGPEWLRPLRLIRENIQPGSAETFFHEGRDQRRFVDHAAPRNVDQNARRTKRIKHRPVDNAAVCGPPDTATIRKSDALADPSRVFGKQRYLAAS